MKTKITFLKNKTLPLVPQKMSVWNRAFKGVIKLKGGCQDGPKSMLTGVFTSKGDEGTDTRDARTQRGAM